MKRILIVAQGTYGDVFPMIALGEALQEAGHAVTIAVEEGFLEMVEERRLTGFVYVRGVLSRVQALPRQNNLQDVLRIVAEATPRAYDALAEWLDAHPVDLVIRHFFEMAALILVQERDLVYVNAFLSGASLLSRYDWPYSMEFSLPPVLIKIPGVARIVAKLWFWSMLGGTLHDYTDFSRRKGVVAQVSFAHVSPHYNLLMCSKLLFPPQPDWPTNLRVTGYAFLEQPEFGAEEFVRFRQVIRYTGERPILLTLGSSGLDDEVQVYTRAVQSLRQVYPRVPVVIIAHTGIQDELRFENVTVFSRINYAQAFPLARLIFHQGGLGTTMEALRSGRPQVIVSRLSDRPDNGLRVERLGCGLYEPDLSVAGIERSRALLTPETLQKCFEAARYVYATPWKVFVREALQDYLHDKVFG